MANDTEIQPALTAEEWAELRSGNTHRQRQGSGVAVGRERVWNSHGTAALCLYGQPFGFTREDVRMLDELAHEPQDGFTVSSAEIRGLANRIRALLPPD